MVADAQVLSSRWDPFRGVFSAVPGRAIRNAGKLLNGMETTRGLRQQAIRDDLEEDFDLDDDDFLLFGGCQAEDVGQAAVAGVEAEAVADVKAEAAADVRAEEATSHAQASALRRDCGR
ncbi:unnamed protein product [Prorocentrum cordatum]|uniref:Uncharacterized protein n=1 Tax=Prorocentrum cordatum TaxID=2364126 RepID=A0ABN9T7Z2_9DINO|nr:unnamed protein product [Polarella glacialis]